MHSLSRRLLLSLFVPLVVFFGVTMVVLDASFRDVAQRSLRDSLDAQIVALIAAAEQQPDGSFEPAAVSPGLETRLSTPGSGLYAQIQSTEPGDVPWRSPSAAGTFIDFGPTVAAGERRYLPARSAGRARARNSRAAASRSRTKPRPAQSHVQRRDESRSVTTSSSGASGASCSAASSC